MAQGMRQILSQQMKLTPQQVLMSSLLQLPITALEQRLKQELEQNPLLEETEELEEDLEEEMELELEQQKPEQEKEDPVKAQEQEETEIKAEKEKEKTEEEEIDWNKLLNDDDHFEVKVPRGQGENDDDQEWIQPARITLSEHLMEQLRWAPLSDAQKTIGEYIIWNINEDGYLIFDEEVQNPEPTSEIQDFEAAASDLKDHKLDVTSAATENEPAPKKIRKKTSARLEALTVIADELQISKPEVEKVLTIIQTFDPSGIAARDLKECILIQLRRRNEDQGFYGDSTGTSLRIVEEAYEDFINRRYDKVAKQLSITMDQIKQSIGDILTLNPKPGEGYITTEQNYITPDATVKKINDKFEIVLNDHDVPHLRINHAYKRMMLEKDKTQKDTKEFIKNKLEAAKWLINSIYRRRDTIYRTIETIVELQKDFFEKGVGHIKPMKLEDIATRISMDISTISRATNSKYIQTDYGVFELKYFFSTSMMSSDGEDVSTKQIKTLLKQVVDEEDKQHPYSDEDLAKVLTDRGTPIARRTITKYREQMMIPAGRLRKLIE